MPLEMGRELFAEVVAELVDQLGFVPPLAVVVYDATRVARVLFRMNGERVVTEGTQ